VLFFDGALGVLALGVWIFCIIDVITTPNGSTRNLPKLAWLFIVIILADIGSIAWLVAGREWNREPVARAARPPAPRRASNPDDDEEFLASLKARAEEQRRRAREQQKDEQQGGADPVG
jgi:hypothetical protein